MPTYVGKMKVDGTNELPIASTLYGTCSTAAATAAKVVTCENFDQLIDGVVINVKFTYTNTVGYPTLNVNSTGAKNIYIYGTTTPGTTKDTSWLAGEVVTFIYLSSNNSWTVVNYSERTDSKVTQNPTSTNSDYPILLKNSTAGGTAETGPVKTTSTTASIAITANPGTGNLNLIKINGVAVGSDPKFTDTVANPMSTVNEMIWDETRCPSTPVTPNITIPAPSSSSTTEHHARYIFTAESSNATFTAPSGYKITDGDTVSSAGGSISYTNLTAGSVYECDVVNSLWYGSGILFLIKKEWSGFPGITYLYNEGDECTSITGGWSNTDYKYNTTSMQPGTKNSDHIYVVGTSSTNVAYGFGTVNAIDLTNYNTLLFDGYKTTSMLGNLIFAATQKSSFNTHGSAISSTDATTRGVYTYDISNLTGNYYIIVYAVYGTGKKGYIYKLGLI